MSEARLTILYGRPDDPAAFDEHYRTTHIPLAARMPGFRRWTITWCDAAPDGTPPAFHCIVELYAATRAHLEAALDTAEAHAASADVATFATGGATYVWGECDDVSFA